MTDTSTLRERIAHAMWRNQAERAGTPGIVRGRTPEAFAEASDETRREWLGYADAALAVIGAQPDLRDRIAVALSQAIYQQTEGEWQPNVRQADELAGIVLDAQTEQPDLQLSGREVEGDAPDQTGVSPDTSAAPTDNTALVEAAGAVLRLWENGCKDHSWRQHFHDALGRLALALASREAKLGPDAVGEADNG
ncbi:hypothetical protein [Paracoccus sp. 22332]|uniref:hypothetical protein n=1 Tax=Paracoccus sp. 22332 TaxID=3453913 RepID=UPI003F879B7C